MNAPLPSSIKLDLQGLINAIVQAIASNKLLIEGDLRRDIQQHLKRLQQIGSSRGIRHR